MRVHALRPWIVLQPGFRARELAGQWIWFFVWLTVTGFALYLRPSEAGHGTHQQLGLPPCTSVFVFGRLCPGCGLTTSFTSIVRGRWDLAWQANPFGYFMYPALSLYALAAGIYGARGIRLSFNTPRMNGFLAVMLGLYVGYSIWRFFFAPVGPGIVPI